MKYAIITSVNGSFSVKSEWTDLNSAIVSYHSVCSTLWNAQETISACVALVDEQMKFEKIEYINHAA